MAYTREQLITYASIVYLVLVTALSAYAASRTNKLSSPISDVLSGFTAALPLVAGLLLKGSYNLTRSQERRQGAPRGQTVRPPFVNIANTIILIYSTVVTTLLGTHAAPGSGLNCDLEQQWKKMFTNKNSEAIKTIQDTLNCCGFVNPHDRAWPFQSVKNNITINECQQSTGRTQGCLVPWKREEQSMAKLLIGVVVLVLVWLAAIMVTPTKKETWLHRILPESVSNLIGDEEQGSSNGGPHRAIGYMPSSRAYSDNVAEEVDEDEAESTPQRTIEESVQTVRNAITNVENVVEQHHHHSATENAWTRN